MSRPIKFRAWDNTKNEWLNKEDTGCLTIYLDGRYEIDRGWVKVFSDLIIEQYTGLTDKNGKEIYEGDIVEIRNKNHRNEYNIGVVRFRKGAFGCPFLLGKYKTGQVEVIGNVHENPELIGGEE